MVASRFGRRPAATLIMIVTLVLGVVAALPATTHAAGGFFGSAPPPGTGDFRTADGDQEIGELVNALGVAGCDVLSLAFFDAPASKFLFHFPATPVISDLTAASPVANGQVFFAACDAGPPTQTPTPEPSIVDAAALVLPNVVQVITQFGAGTAFYIGNDEFVTAAHVVADVTTVQLVSDEIDVEARVVGLDEETDVALLAVGDGALARRVPGAPGVAVGVAAFASQVGLTPLQWGDSSALRPAMTVGAAGYPPGVSGAASVTTGIVSRIFQTEGRIFESEGVTIIQTDTAVNPGNSGGPLFDTRGRVIGVVTAKLVDEALEGIGYAVAASDAREGLERARENPPNPAVTAVALLEGWLGQANVLVSEGQFWIGELNSGRASFVETEGVFDDLADRTRDLAREIRAASFAEHGAACEFARVAIEEAVHELSLAYINIAGLATSPTSQFIDTVNMQLGNVFGLLALIDELMLIDECEAA